MRGKVEPFRGHVCSVAAEGFGFFVRGVDVAHRDAIGAKHLCWQEVALAAGTLTLPAQRGIFTGLQI
jgi:hypothetical protein